MMQLEIAGKRYPVAAGETVIGSAPESGILLAGEGVRPRHAVVQGTSEGSAAIRSAEPGADLLINGVRLGTDPTPVLHGDKIQIAGHEILAVDPARTGNTQLFDSGAFADLVPRAPAKPPAGGTGGRLVCLTDGREYSIDTDGLVFGRDASADVVVSGTEVSRRHAEIRITPDGYVLMDLSVNGTLVNGQRVGRSHLLARADVIRIGNDEFRFYADAAPPQAPLGPRPTPPGTGPIRPPTGAGARLSDTLHGLPAGALTESEAPTPARAVPAVPIPAPLASLLVRSGSLRGRRMPIRVPVVNVGRADYNDIVLAEPSVSTTHAKLQRRDDIWVLTDLGSTNGTYVEGEPVTGETALTPGTTIRFGDVAVLFEPHDEPAVPRPGATQLLDRVEAEPAHPPSAEDPRPPEPRPPRRAIRAAAPKPSGPPLWVVALLVLIGLVVAYLLLTSS